jgi:exopolysaccharide production protein ExoY
MRVRIDSGVTDFNRPTVAPQKNWLFPFRERFYRGVLKRTIDIVLVLMALPIVVPTIVILAFLVSRDGHSPFYRQERLGMGGRIFSMWKLRSMVPDADARLAAYLAGDEAARREWDAYQKLTEDPRITPLGKLLRKTSLDELPQLWNVLKGDMSLVGPRPMMPQQRALYPGYAYFTMRPGVTGLWQVSDRNASTFAQRAEFDADYERKLSLATDMSVLLATVAVVLRGTGQ